MFVNLEMCKAVLIAGESTDCELSAAIFIELLKFFCEVVTIIFRMQAYVGDVSGAQLAGRRGEGGRVSPILF